MRKLGGEDGKRSFQHRMGNAVGQFDSKSLISGDED